jgi:molybdopterin molybdotransferase
MSPLRDNEGCRKASGGDIRLQGFRDRASFEEAVAWVDQLPLRPAFEEVTIEQAPGRVLQAPWTAPSDVPAAACAIIDGYAVRALETVGAGNYNPLPFGIQESDIPLRPACAALLAAGGVLPQGADAVLPFDAVQRNGSVAEVCRAVAPGAGIERAGQQLRAGAECLGNRPLRPEDVALLAAFNVRSLQVVRRPCVALIVAGPKPGVYSEAGDANGPMLRALIARDHGLAGTVALEFGGQDAIAGAIKNSYADLLLVAGRTGAGQDDDARLALAAAGQVAIHGIALRPGGSAGMGTAGPTPVFLLPGEPLACRFAYELLAGRLVRKLAGYDPRLPYVVREFEAGRKIVSTVGVVEVCQVRLIEGKVEPLGSPESGGLASAVRADGFVLVPAAVEGYPAGGRVPVHLFAEQYV